MRHRPIALIVALQITAASAVGYPVRALAQSAADQPPAAELQRAAALFTKSDWNAAFEAYSALARQYPKHALSRFRVGVSQLGMGRFAESEANLLESERLGVPVGQAAYRMAQALAEQHKDDAALAQLKRSAGVGFFVPGPALAGDAHLASLHANAGWHEVVVAFDAIVQPCKYDQRFREFDFWVGDWDVRPTVGAAPGPPARNTVTIEDNGCVVMEHWVAPGGSQGQSFNLFDRSLGKWRQTWVDNVGGQHDYAGELKDGNMAFTGDTPAPNGSLGRIPTHLTFFRISADSVRQFSETSPDSGKTWQTSYDLIYVRRKGSLPGVSPELPKR
ncbi:MAG: hypothetical protein ABIT38_15600 [Gemmatimonadaceae bacterium]